ncbi:citrate lyase acyl carrier protein [Limnobaculum xujianqingii]|uniref:citrate lyase acyl carrier protein n=1 Tax=Limnobaculum xujianqingii TaxID=2738837 RepID=UPI001128A72D|nr:citrate lyase acyl carrier protein [Limnobaculum xujianqingii]
MKIVKEAVAGTLESSDVMVRIAPIGGSEIDLQLNSSVEKQFGDAIRETMMDTLSKLGVTGVQLIIDDKGALDCILRARLQTVLLRASDSKELPWGALK